MAATTLKAKKPTKVADPQLSDGRLVEDALLNWRALCDALGTATEEDTKTLMEWEKSHKNRESFKIRLFGKFSELRTERERKEYLGT